MTQIAGMAPCAVVGEKRSHQTRPWSCKDSFWMRLPFHQLENSNTSMVFQLAMFRVLFS